MAYFFRSQTSLKPCHDWLFENYGIIVVVLLDGVEFLRKSFRVKKEKDFRRHI